MPLANRCVALQHLLEIVEEDAGEQELVDEEQARDGPERAELVEAAGLGDWRRVDGRLHGR